MTTNPSVKPPRTAWSTGYLTYADLASLPVLYADIAACIGSGWVTAEDRKALKALQRDIRRTLKGQGKG